MTRAAVQLLGDDAVLPQPQTVNWVGTSMLRGFDDAVFGPVVARFAT